MSNIESDLDLDKLFLPAWAQVSPAYNKYAKFAGEPERAERRGDDRFGRRPSRPGPGAPRDGGPSKDLRGRGPRRDGGGGPRSGKSQGHREERREPAPLPEIELTLLPDEKGVDSLARQIKMTGRAYPLFEIAKLILQKPERQQVRFDVIKVDGKILEPLFLCALDDSLWLSTDEAVGHVLRKHFGTFYQTERTPTDPPKGTYTFVAQCGMSGTILGPPNYHDYQNQLRKLHQERFSKMPFETYKARVKIVKDEAVVKKWIEDQSFKTQFATLNVPETELKKLENREEVEKHFREVHLPNIIKEVESHTMSGPASRELRSPGLQRLLRHGWEEQKRFPIKVVTVLSNQFAQRGLQFFKVNKTITHVSVARPHYLDLQATPVSDGVKKIVDFVEAHSRCTRRQLVEALAASPRPPAAVAPATVEGTAPAPAPAEAAVPTPEQTAVISDLHWLIHQGHVIEFADGLLETAKKPNPRPVRAEPKKTAATPAAAGGPAAVPNASTEDIAPAVSAMEATRPVAADGSASANGAHRESASAEDAGTIQSSLPVEEQSPPVSGDEKNEPDAPAPA